MKDNSILRNTKNIHCGGIPMIYDCSNQQYICPHCGYILEEKEREINKKLQEANHENNK